MHLIPPIWMARFNCVSFPTSRVRSSFVEFSRLSIVTSRCTSRQPVAIPLCVIERLNDCFLNWKLEIKGAEVTIHCTITSQIADREGYLENFLRFWCDWQEVKKVWFSLFTPQRGAKNPEILTPAQRVAVMKELYRLRQRYSILDMTDAVIAEIEKPPRNPSECIFARTTAIFSADLKTSITPCQFGGDPDCEQCGCIASTGLAVVGHHRVLGLLTAGHIFGGSELVGRPWKGPVEKRKYLKPKLLKGHHSRSYETLCYFLRKTVSDAEKLR